MKNTELIVNDEHLKLCEIPENIEELQYLINKRLTFYMYDQAKEIIQMEILPRFREAVNENNNRGRMLFLYGDYNTGKSYLMQYTAALLRKSYPSFWKPQKHPIIILDLRDDINTAQQFYLYILDQIKCPVDSKQINQWKKTNVVEVRLRNLLIAALERFETRLIILDECQRLLKARNPNIPNIFEALKDLTNKIYWQSHLRTHIIMCGTDDGIALLEAENWIQGRACTIRLKELSLDEYLEFLVQIYRDYRKLGISKLWDLVTIDESTGKKSINRKRAKFLYKRSFGKAGLTVDIIKDAIKYALNSNRLYPVESDYKLVNVNGQMAGNGQSNLVKTHRIEFNFKDHACKVPGCPKSKEKSYKNYKPLKEHYKNKHPEVLLVNNEGRRI